MQKSSPSKQDIEDAFIRYDNGERQVGRSPARSTYVVNSNGRGYPAKHIWGLATGTQYFQTQDAEAGFRKLGFKVSLKGDLVEKGIPRNSDISTIASVLNKKSNNFDIGKLQNIRKEIKGLKRRASPFIFHERTTFPSENGGYCFHDGGRTELQFNVGYELHNDTQLLRHGLAFSLEIGQTLPSIDPLLPKIYRLNDYLASHLELFSDMRLWVWNGEQRSENHFVGPIPLSWIKSGAFICLGHISEPTSTNYENILSDFDRLLNVYRYVEGPLDKLLESLPNKKTFEFKPGFSRKRSNSNASSTEKILDVRLLHNDMQFSLCKQLSQEFGEENVSDEVPNGIGGAIDIVRKVGENYWFYEIKTSDSPKACIREALGQLLEYSYWPGTNMAKKLIVIGPNVIDGDGELYLAKLRKSMNLPIYYESFSPT